MIHYNTKYIHDSPHNNCPPNLSENRKLTRFCSSVTELNCSLHKCPIIQAFWPQQKMIWYVHFKTNLLFLKNRVEDLQFSFPPHSHTLHIYTHCSVDHFHSKQFEAPGRTCVANNVNNDWILLSSLLTHDSQLAFTIVRPWMWLTEMECSHRCAFFLQLHVKMSAVKKVYLHCTILSCARLDALWPSTPLCYYICQMMDPFGSTDNSLSNSCQSIDQALDRWVIVCCLWFMTLIFVDWNVWHVHTADQCCSRRLKLDLRFTRSQGTFVNRVQGQQSSPNLSGLPVWRISQVTLLVHSHRTPASIPSLSWANRGKKDTSGRHERVRKDILDERRN